MWHNTVLITEAINIAVCGRCFNTDASNLCMKNEQLDSQQANTETLSFCACSHEVLSVQSIPACADRGDPPFCYQAAAAVEIPSAHFYAGTYMYYGSQKIVNSPPVAQLGRHSEGYKTTWKEWAAVW